MSATDKTVAEVMGIAQGYRASPISHGIQRELLECAIRNLVERAEKAEQALAQQAKAEPVAWCALLPNGRIAYFEGKPMVMPGPVGNEHHPVPLYAHPKEHTNG